MNPDFIWQFAEPILVGDADYVKGNRFYYLSFVKRMPIVRLIGNTGLSFFAKLSTGYWDLFDPTNGYTAIHADVAKILPLEEIASRVFFESDILYHLALMRARVVELPLETVYGNEKSNLSVMKCLVTFPFHHMKNFFGRLLYNYFLRNFSLASINLVIGTLLLSFGLVFGILKWLYVMNSGEATTAGTVMLAALPLIIGSQLLLSFFSFDMSMMPREPIHRTAKRMTMLTSANRESDGDDKAEVA